MDNIIESKTVTKTTPDGRKLNFLVEKMADGSERATLIKEPAEGKASKKSDKKEEADA
jgi:hypothetical protein